MTVVNGFSDIKVTLLDGGVENPFAMFWNWYRETWYSLRNQEYDPSNPKHVEAAKEVVAGTALPVPLEALNFQIRVEGISRVGLAQFTRGRVGWAYCVTSQMPEAIEHRVTGRARSAGPHIPSITNLDNQPDWKFNKSAWFSEMLELPDHLLFPGEREMIDDWKSIGYEARVRKVEGKN